MDAQRAKLLLLVDDEARSARMLARMLREDGFEVEVTFDGAGAISRLTRSPVPDALLTDFRMSNVDGVAVAKYARSVSPTMPILFITGYPQLVSRRVASLGAQIHAKPLDYQALSQAVRRMLGEHMDLEMARLLQRMESQPAALATAERAARDELERGPDREEAVSAFE